VKKLAKKFKEDGKVPFPQGIRILSHQFGTQFRYRYFKFELLEFNFSLWFLTPELFLI
jgi:hypothetical protein